MFGVSYDGLTSAMTLLRPHPALKAISEQASPADQWMNDDDHRYGALRESYAFEYAVYEQADKNANTHFDFETYDTYSWYLALGPLSNINAKYLHGSIPYWNSIVEHPGLRRVLEGRSVGHAGEGRVRAEPERRRLLGSGRSVGAVGDLSPLRAQRSQPLQLHRRRPVVPRPVAQPEGRVDRPGLVRRPRHRGGVPREDRGAVVPLLAARQGREVSVEGVDVPDRIEQLADLRRLAAEGDRDQPLPARQRRRSRSIRRRPATATCSTSRIRRTRCRTGSGRSRRPIRPATGGAGKSRISASWTTVPTSRPGSARRSIAT